MALKKSPEFAKAPAWNESHEEQYEAMREAERSAIIQTHVRKQKRGADGFKREYDLYLSSAEWKAKRAKVLDRAKGICEGCLEQKATQVHHLTYKHFKCEFMFELIAICDECHARLHDDSDEQSEWADDYPCDACRWVSEDGGRRWCAALHQYAADALAEGGDCGPERACFEPLK
jgi:5-methylcytosine-specific restriction endonuclease McrA